MAPIKKLLYSLLCWLALGGWTTISIDFRATSGYVTDPANATYNLCNTDPSYGSGGSTRGGAGPFGWVSVYVDAERDRSSGVSDKRFAGVCQRPNNGTQDTWKLSNVTSGTYTVCVAMGDADNDQPYQHVEIYDNTTLRGTMNDTDGTTTGNFDDSVGTQYSVANYYSSATCFTGVTISSGLFVMKTGTTTNVGASNSTVSNVTLTLTGGGASGNLPKLQAIGEE